MASSFSFADFGLQPGILSSLKKLGYEKPTPVQVSSIPILMAGDDLLAQAQTGTGKTAAFAIPALSALDLALKRPQVLVIAPTRELALQVSESFRAYAAHLKGFAVAAIYGGSDLQEQLKKLKQGVHVVVGTPGRLMDHLRRSTLKADALKMVILDEADEMLKMGFVDDVEWILGKLPESRQTALFSATMPERIRHIAKRYQQDARKVKIKSQDISLATIEQQYMLLPQQKKSDALMRFLAIESCDAVMIFTRTKVSSMELAQKLQRAGHSVAALNGDMKQLARQRAIKQIKSGALDIIVATDVAARGIDVDRISHVINYDIPPDTETYLHRTGRTGRAGRHGKAVLLVTPKEQGLLKRIEREIRKKLVKVEPPSAEVVSLKRSELMIDTVSRVIQKSKKLKPYYKTVNRMVDEGACATEDVAAALLYLLSSNR